jgi:hypothetical protein
MSGDTYRLSTSLYAALAGEGHVQKCASLISPNGAQVSLEEKLHWHEAQKYECTKIKALVSLLLLLLFAPPQPISLIFISP